MDIGWYRDLVICISGLIVMVVVIFIAILAFLLFRKVRPILENVQATTDTVREVTSTVKEELVKPVLQISTLIRGITQGIELVSKIFKKGEQEGGCNG